MRQSLPSSLGEVLLLEMPMNIKDKHMFLASSCLFLHVVIDQASNFVKLRFGGKKLHSPQPKCVFPCLSWIGEEGMSFLTQDPAKPEVYICICIRLLSIIKCQCIKLC